MMNPQQIQNMMNTFVSSINRMIASNNSLIRGMQINIDLLNKNNELISKQTVELEKLNKYLGEIGPGKQAKTIRTKDEVYFKTGVITLCKHCGVFHDDPQTCPKFKKEDDINDENKKRREGKAEHRDQSSAPDND